MQRIDPLDVMRTPLQRNESLALRVGLLSRAPRSRRRAVIAQNQEIVAIDTYG